MVLSLLLQRPCDTSISVFTYGANELRVPLHISPESNQEKGDSLKLTITADNERGQNSSNGELGPHARYLSKKE